ncbi:hypothetical protein OOZ35_07720 [Mesoflavibacter profundi]|uniref:Polymerase beta nucleotidyltransferase domain-containing protein n=1 Tax=Mesoflavibacter profundi TaxID=2708110 RepID=A0ABT4S0F3_9FLAO|nr:hypothetical protein [Mesoflavibacter profundi]MDA0177373.1 hypothetical protein [Mesoflavibacter profundi]
MKLIIQVVVGYMYKVLKNKLDTSDFKFEFAAIRHGDYYDFITSIGKEIDFIVVYNKGQIEKETNIKESDIDYVGLVKSGESLREFYKKCYLKFGEINDCNLSDSYFEKAALYELSLRMHLNNKRLTKNRITLENVINRISELKNLTNQETEILHKGRKFLNFIKRPEKLKSDWNTVTSDFDEAYSLIENKKLTIE